MRLVPFAGRPGQERYGDVPGVDVYHTATLS